MCIPPTKNLGGIIAWTYTAKKENKQALVVPLDREAAPPLVLVVVFGRARVRTQREEISLAYFESLGRDIPRYCQVIVDEMLDDGIEAAVICYGLHEAAKAPSPSWRYAAAVIARCVREGIRTAADLSTSQARAKSTARSTGWPQARKVREQMYTQREYQETDELPAWMQERIRQMIPQ